jgi:lipopolysaccharide export system ATP-binding protein
MIEAKSISKSYKKRKVVDNINLNLKRGEIVGLLGPNGAGKTTTFYIITGLISPDNGEIIFEEKDISNFSVYERAKIGISYLPQEASIFRKLTVEENVLAVLEIMNKDRGSIEKNLQSILDEFNLLNIRKSKGYEISGGERRRVEIVRTLVLNPSFILLDEPFAGIDPIVVNDLQMIIKKLKEKNIGILISDHNVRETLKICDRAYILNKGEILLEGTPEKIISDVTARKIYLGDNFTI